MPKRKLGTPDSLSGPRPNGVPSCTQNEASHSGQGSRQVSALELV